MPFPLGSEWDVEMGRAKRIPRCVGLAQGLLVSQTNVGSGRVSFGPCSIVVGAAATHIGLLRKATNLQGRSDWVLAQFAEIFTGFSKELVLLDFDTSLTRNFSQVLLGFATASDRELFSSKFVARFPVVDFSG